MEDWSNRRVWVSSKVAEAESVCQSFRRFRRNWTGNCQNWNLKGALEKWLFSERFLDRQKRQRVNAMILFLCVRHFLVGVRPRDIFIRRVKLPHECSNALVLMRTFHWSDFEHTKKGKNKKFKYIFFMLVVGVFGESSFTQFFALEISILPHVPWKIF